MIKVIAYAMHEQEIELGRRLVTNAEVTESFVIGDIEESNIPQLMETGLIVQKLEQAEPSASTGEIDQGMTTFGLTSADSATDVVDVVDEPSFYLVQISGPLTEQRFNQLSYDRIELLEQVPGKGYTCRLTPEQVPRLRNLDFVKGVRLYRAEDTLAAKPTPIQSEPGAVPFDSPDINPAMLTYDVLLHRGQDLPTVLQWLGDQSVGISGSGGRKIRMSLLEGSSTLDDLASLPEVARVELYVPPKLHNDHARFLLGIDQLNPSTSLAQQGEGQIVAVADTGLDETHPDFQGRIEGVVARGRAGVANDPHGHGTHVAGSVLGDGTASSGMIRGTAPKAKLFFQSLLDQNGDLGGLPLSLGDLFSEAYQSGARIHNNSWGAATNSMYTIDSTEVDEYIAGNPDMLVVISAGNEGTAANNLNALTGYVDWLSIGSPASCKNALTVGASRSDRADGAYSTFTYGDIWPNVYPHVPIMDEKVSGNPQGMAAFSSRGPCDDRRIKPDVVAPGTDIASAKSSLSPLRQYWGPYPSNPKYAFMGGTSMAAPLVSGCAALVREYYQRDRSYLPSAALVKATLINGTVWLSGDDSIADFKDCPNYHQGFGCVYMPTTLPNSAKPKHKLEFIDTWNNPALPKLQITGKRLRFRIEVDSGEDLRICLTYTDLAARALQNNLNLFVQDEMTLQKYLGNQDVPGSLKIPDPDNNVEIIRIFQPQRASYLIQISAINLLRGPQEFALVITGNLRSSLKLA